MDKMTEESASDKYTEEISLRQSNRESASNKVIEEIDLGQYDRGDQLGKKMTVETIKSCFQQACLHKEPDTAEDTVLMMTMMS